MLWHAVLAVTAAGVCHLICRAVLYAVCCAVPQVISGLVKFVPKDQMENRRVVREAQEAAATAALGQHAAVFPSFTCQANRDGTAAPF